MLRCWQEQEREIAKALRFNPYPSRVMDVVEILNVRARALKQQTETGDLREGTW